MTSNGEKIKDVTYRETYNAAGGSAEGYVYSIQLHKQNEEKVALVGQSLQLHVMLMVR